MVFYENEKMQVNSGWRDFLNQEFQKPYFQKLQKLIQEMESHQSVFPPKHLRFKSLEFFAPEETKVLILGQDPYHGVGQAHGLSFSVPMGVAFPPSLRNIFKELKSDLNLDAPFSGDLSPWAREGVLLLNSALTVEEANAGSHLKWGWEEFTDSIIKYLSQKNKRMVFVLWGKYAESKSKFIDQEKHLCLKSAHPSPLSAHRGFFGSKPFSQANHFLESHNLKPVSWRLD